MAVEKGMTWAAFGRRLKVGSSAGSLAFRLAMFVLVCLAGLSQTGRGASADLLPHRAVYVLSSGGKSSAGGVDGLMSFEIKDTCDGWTTDIKTELTMTGGGGEAHNIGWSQATWEAKDGSRYRFFYKEHTDGKETVRRRGEARLDPKTGRGSIVTDLPNKLETELKQGTLFPVRHSIELAAHAAAGEPYFLAQVFDGTAGEAAIEVGAAIGRATTNWDEDETRFPALRGVKSHPIAFAYYIGSSPEGLPDTEQNLRFYENTVVTMLTFLLGDLEVVARLDQLETLAPEKC